jgi:hypothetical protein
MFYGSSGASRRRAATLGALTAALLAGSFLFSIQPSSAAGVADVGVTVTGAGAVVPSGAYTNTVTLKNAGLVPALTANVSYDVSGGATITSVNDTACTFTATTMACSYGLFAPGTSHVVTVGLNAPGTGALNADGYATVVQHAHENAVFDNLASDANRANDDSTLNTVVAISDVGVALSKAEPAVTNGLDQLVTATIANVGTRRQAAMSLKVVTGGTVDNNATLPLPGNCALSGLITNQTVTCNYSNVAGGAPASNVQILIKTPAIGSSMTTSASKTQTIGEFGGSVANDTASLSTPLSASTPCGYNCTQAVVKQGSSITWNSPSGDIIQTFSVPANANWTGGAVKVTLRRITATFTCGGLACYDGVPEILAEPLNTTSTPSPTSPLVSEVSYLFNQVCGGNGGPSGCHQQHYLLTGVYSGDAPVNPDCPSFGTATGPFNTGSFNNCRQFVQKINNNQVKITALFLRDISLPLLGKGSA